MLADPSDTRSARTLHVEARRRDGTAGAAAAHVEAFEACATCVEHWPFVWNEVVELPNAAPLCEVWEALVELQTRGAALATGDGRSWWWPLFRTAASALRCVPTAGATAAQLVLRDRLLRAQLRVADALYGGDNVFSLAARQLAPHLG